MLEFPARTAFVIESVWKRPPTHIYSIPFLSRRFSGPPNNLCAGELKSEAAPKPKQSESERLQFNVFTFAD